MTENGVNIYKAARMASGLTQERAAELLGCATRTIAAYEQSERIPFDDIVVRMIDIYGTPFLGNQHLRQTSKIACELLPDVAPTNLPQAVLHLQCELNRFLALRDEMIDITEDGVISDAEKPRWAAVTTALDNVCQAILSVKFSERSFEEHEDA